MGKTMAIPFPEKYKGDPALLEFSETVNVYNIIREFSKDIAALSVIEQASLLRSLAFPENTPEVSGSAAEIFAMILLRIVSEKSFQDAGKK